MGTVVIMSIILNFGMYMIPVLSVDVGTDTEMGMHTGIDLNIDMAQNIEVEIGIGRGNHVHKKFKIRSIYCVEFSKEPLICKQLKPCTPPARVNRCVPDVHETTW